MTLRPTKAERALPWAERPARAREARSDQDQAIDILGFQVCETADNSGDRCIGNHFRHRRRFQLDRRRLGEQKQRVVLLFFLLFLQFHNNFRGSNPADDPCPQ
jgi:hypothetical protein